MSKNEFECLKWRRGRKELWVRARIELFAYESGAIVRPIFISFVDVQLSALDELTYS